MFVAPVRVTEIERAYFVRCTLEIALARRAAVQLGAKSSGLIEDNLRQQAKALDEADCDRFSEFDGKFHCILSSAPTAASTAARNSVSLPRAWRIISAIKGQLDRVQYVSLPERSHGQLVL